LSTVSRRTDLYFGTILRFGLAALLVAMSAAVALPAQAQAAAPEEPPLAKVRAVVVVDESNSLGANDVAEEKIAAELIANSGQFHSDSDVAVIGFGSYDRPGQDAAAVRCPLAPVRSTDFASCIPKLHDRTDSEGSGTDHTAALRRALEIFNEPGGEDLFKIVFFLTDGGLRVDNSPQYGRPQTPQETDEEAADRHNNEALRQLTQDVLPEANHKHVQIWPLGFGNGIDQAGLDRLADGGGGANPDCVGVDVAQPTKRIARPTDNIGRTILDALANATCSKSGVTKERGLESGGEVTLPIEIPVTASTGSINVEKRDPRIRLQFFDPKNRDVTALRELDGSSFSLAGETGTAASLGVSSPLPGTWKVRFTSPKGVPRQNVTATLLWKGVLNSSVILDPVAPKPGEPLTVRLHLLTSRGQPIRDPATLDAMDFSAALRGEGIEPRPVKLNDDGVAPDDTANDGEFAGRVDVPSSASGGVCVEGRVFAPGLTGDVRSYCTRPSGERSGGAVITLNDDEIAPGGRLSGILKMDNPGEARQVRLELNDLPGANLEQSVTSVPAGAAAFVHDFAVVFDPQAPTGLRSGTLIAIDDDSNEVLGNAFIDIDVDFPPGWAERNWFVFPLAAAGLLLLALILLLLLRRARNRADVQDLSVTLLRGERHVASLNAPRHRSSAFVFDIDDEGGTLVLNHAKGAGRHHVVRRGRHGTLVVSTPDGRRENVRAGEPVPLQQGVVAVVQDARIDPGGGWGADTDAWGTADAGWGASDDTWGSRGAAGRPPHAADQDATYVPGAGFGESRFGADAGTAAGHPAEPPDPDATYVPGARRAGAGNDHAHPAASGWGAPPSPPPPGTARQLDDNTTVPHPPSSGPPYSSPGTAGAFDDPLL
jgi:hypothetical protein